MLGLASSDLSWFEGLLVVFSVGLTLVLANTIYNLFFHPLADIPGPFWGRVSGIPSWYHAYRGDRHIWLWKQFKVHGKRIRLAPNTVMFCDPKAYADIYSMKSNVRRGDFYEALRRNKHENTTITTVDVAEHSIRHKRLSLCFTERSVRAASSFIIKHIDRWIELLMQENEPSTGDKTSMEWTTSLNFSDKIDHLVFDIMGDLSFGRSFNIKEPIENPLKRTPYNISEYMRFYYLMCRLPQLKLFLWLKPRGVDQILDLITPPAARQYNQFVDESVSNRIALQKQQADKPEAERRQDIFYFLAEARDSSTGALAYGDSGLRAESNLLIIAGSNTTAVTLSGIFFYLTGNPSKCAKLVEEIRTTFRSVDDIIYGPKLLGCRYLKACVDEGMRLTPSGPSELPREVLPGGQIINGRFYPEGTVVGTSPWVNSRDPEVYGDAEVFRPERWISDDEEAVARAKAGFHPFLSGPANCVGQNLAMAMVLLTVARTLHSLDVRRAPGSTLGGGNNRLGTVPGPTLAALTQWVEIYYECFKSPGGQFMWEYQKWHEKYGPIVRIGPNEVHIQDPKFYDVLYSNSRHSDKLKCLEHRFNNDTSMFATPDHHVHRIRRAAVNPFFSKKKISQYSPAIQSCMDTLCKRVESEFLANGNILNLSNMWGAFAGDIMVGYTLENSYNFIMSPGFRAEISDSMAHLLNPVHFATHFPWMIKATKFLPKRLIGLLSPSMRSVNEFIDEMGKQIIYAKAVYSSGEKNPKVVQSLFSSLFDSGLPPSELKTERLQHEAIGIIGAGLETTAYTLAVCSYHLLSSPEIYRKLKVELTTAITDPENIPELDTLMKLPYLTCVINEALRFAYGTPQRMPRLSPTPMTYITAERTYVLPARSIVSMDNYSTSHDPWAFPNPYEFRPERWEGDARAPDGKLLTTYLVAFGRGTRSCVGMPLAYADFYIAVASFFRRFDCELFQTERDAVDCYLDSFITRPKPGTKGVRVKVLRSGS
ncbi:hypothetical protein GQX73_g3287 [Xylaria multiplex]|uniref:Cytochrome P450 n=1 Tax=Xylaria multiplex TaxID=323545 RepID=A0A7C8IXN9_9PEZI|nr:hypothetical protein GQX73_g3287 [Xylaria multiplex]